MVDVITLGISVVTTVIGIFLGALFLMLSTKIFKVQDQSYMSALYVTAIVGVVSFLIGLVGMFSVALAMAIVALNFIISIILGIVLIKNKYALDWGKSILVWLVYFVISLVAMFIIGLIIAAIVVAVGLSAVGLGGLAAA